VKTFQSFSETFVEPHSNLEAEPGYLYHATNTDHASDIAQEGLKPFRPDYGTDQSCWPDGQREKRIYMSQHANKVWMFAPAEGKSVILRVPKSTITFKQEIGTGDMYTTQPIPAKHLDILKDDAWVPLASAF
jgi:hypothetical protein